MAAVENPAVLEEIRTFCEEHPHIPVIAVLPDLTVSDFAEAVRCGAIVAIAEDEPPETFVDALEAASRGWATVPASVLRAMAARIPRRPDPAAWVTEDEADWLRHLAAGATVTDLAEQVGYSEREMFRTLRETYARLGAKNRTEAIIWATRHGVLNEGETHTDESA